MVVSPVKEGNMEELEFETGPAFPRQLDTKDDLASFREAFIFADKRIRQVNLKLGLLLDKR